MRKHLGVFVLSCVGLVGSAAAGTFSHSPDPAGVVRGGAATTVQFLYAGDGDSQDAQLDINISDATDLTIVANTIVAGSTCATAGTLLRIVPPSGAGTALTSTPTAYCSFDITAAAGATLGTRTFATAFIECVPLGAGDTCTFNSMGVNITDAPVVTPPTLTGTYTTRAAAAGTTGTTIIVGDIDFSVVTPAANGGTGSISCVDSDAANPPVLTINPANQTGLTTTVADATVSCGLTLAVQNGSVQCTLVNGGVQSYAVTCPAGSAVPPIPVPPTPAIIPASSMWSQLSLIGLLAALGLLVVALRRNH